MRLNSKKETGMKKKEEIPVVEQIAVFVPSGSFIELPQSHMKKLKLKLDNYIPF
jgi:hypothetical protein